MKNSNYIDNVHKIGLLCLAFWLCIACEDELEVNDPYGQIPQQEVFENEATATAAVTTMYAKLRDNTILTGQTNGLSILMGMYTDELDYYGLPGQPMEPFYIHQINASDAMTNTLWNNAYKLIYMANTALAGLDNSTVLTEEVKNQLRGEAFFMRGLTHFYLTNLFGEIPYVTATDYETNSSISKSTVDEVYTNILSDLDNAQDLLEFSFIDGERIRANKWVVAALKARVFMYREQWSQAEQQCNILLNQPGTFSLEPQLENVFLKESNETIWQLKPKNEGDNTYIANLLTFVTPPPQIAALTDNFASAFEENDLRKEHWVGEIEAGATTWYFPFKYKQNSNTGMSLEYPIAIRLAELYLIRAEARARQGNSSGAQQDLNTIRQRAGLPPTTANTTETLVEAIVSERRFELFTEHGHRWFDLKRTGKANKVLAPIKPGWQPTNVLLPIPEAELLMNPNLNPQNPGY